MPKEISKNQKKIPFLKYPNEFYKKHENFQEVS